MKIITAGSRGIDDYDFLEKIIKTSQFDITQIISGMCPNSPDIAGVLFSEKFKIPLIKCPATWRPNGKYDPKAGSIRNQEMANIANGLILVYNGFSSGSTDMMEKAVNAGIPIEVNIVPPASNIKFRIWSAHESK